MMNMALPFIPVFKPLPENDPTRRKPDISLAREKLGWSPTIKLEEGLKPTIDYFARVIGR